MFQHLPFSQPPPHQVLTSCLLGVQDSELNSPHFLREALKRSSGSLLRTQYARTPPFHLLSPGRLLPKSPLGNTSVAMDCIAMNERKYRFILKTEALL